MKDHYVFLAVVVVGLLFAYWCYRQHVAEAATQR